MAQTTGGGIVVYHTVHHSAVDTEEKTWLPEFAEVAQVVAPVGLRDDGHTVACRLERAPYDGCAKRGVVDIGIAGYEDDVDHVPPEAFHLVECYGQKVSHCCKKITL